MNILVTGGAGYIGSHTVRRLIERNHRVTVIDDLSSGNLWALPKPVKLFKASISDKPKLDHLLSSNSFDAVMHFAAFIDANESVQEPLKYFSNNTTGTLELLAACRKHSIDKFIFSSTAAVYGQTSPQPVREDTPCRPINPYGASKYAAEQAIHFLAAADNRFRAVSLRYFNVGGAHSSLEIGPSHQNDVRSLVRVAASVAAATDAGSDGHLEVYGDNYDTPDGTCIRDYIHVEDLAEAHVNALDYLAAGGSSDVFNVGYNKGQSVLEVVEAMKRVSNSDFAVVIAPGRSCDPTAVVANSEKIREKLDWSPRLDNLDKICESAYLWEKKMSRH